MTGAAGDATLTAVTAAAAPRLWVSAITTATAFAFARSVAAVIATAPTRRPPAFDLAGELLAAVVVGGTVAWLARRVGGSWPSRTLAVGLLAFASVTAVMIEGSAFVPGLSPVAELPLGLLLQLGVSLAAAAVATATSLEASEPAAVGRMPAFSFAVRLAAAAAVYVVAYVVTGAANYVLVTGPYYASQAGGLVLPALSIVLAVAVLEGLLLSLGSLPFARAAGGSLQSRALACGVVLSVLGGIVPLLQASTLPDVLRLASAVEIFFQKMPLGVAVVWLLAARRPDRTGR